MKPAVEFAQPPSEFDESMSRLKLMALKIGVASVNWSTPGIQLGVAKLPFPVGSAAWFCDCRGKQVLLLS